MLKHMFLACAICGHVCLRAACVPGLPHRVTKELHPHVSYRCSNLLARVLAQCAGVLYGACRQGQKAGCANPSRVLVQDQKFEDARRVVVRSTPVVVGR